MNNVWSDGAQNQYPGEVEYYARKLNALRAYTEWMPIRWNLTATPQINVPGIYAINRTFDFGKSMMSMCPPYSVCTIDSHYWVCPGMAVILGCISLGLNFHAADVL